MPHKLFKTRFCTALHSTKLAANLVYAGHAYILTKWCTMLALFTMLAEYTMLDVSLFTFTADTSATISNIAIWMSINAHCVVQRAGSMLEHWQELIAYQRVISRAICML